MAAGLWPQGGAALQNLAGVPAQKFAAPPLLDDNQPAAEVGGPVPGRRGSLERTISNMRPRRHGRPKPRPRQFFQPVSPVHPRPLRDLVPADAAKLQLHQMRGPGRSSNISAGVDSRGQTCFGHSANHMRVRLKSPPATLGGSFSRRSRFGAWRAGQACRWRRV